MSRYEKRAKSRIPAMQYLANDSVLVTRVRQSMHHFDRSTGRQLHNQISLRVFVERSLDVLIPGVAVGTISVGRAGEERQRLRVRVGVGGERSGKEAVSLPPIPIERPIIASKFQAI